MFGFPVTSGLSWKRSSASASETTNTSSPRIACAQNATSREVSLTGNPFCALNHWRLESIMLIAPIGVPQMPAAMASRSS